MLEAVMGKMARAHAEAGESKPLHAGLSALLLELLFRHALQDEARAGAYTTQRRTMLLETARKHRSSFAADVSSFEVPAVRTHADAFLRELRKALRDRLPKRAMLRAAVAALREAGLPEDPWPYVEPQLERHGHVFGFAVTGALGGARKFVVRNGLRLMAMGSSDND